MEVSQTMLNVGACVLAGVIAYLLGSISFAIIVSRIYAHDDVRKYMEQKCRNDQYPENLWKDTGIFTLLGDFLKGVLAVVIGRWIFSIFGVTEFDAGYLAGFFALLGHLYRFILDSKEAKVFLPLWNYTGCKSIGIFILLIIFLPVFVYHKNCFVGFGYRRTALSVCYIDR